MRVESLLWLGICACSLLLAACLVKATITEHRRKVPPRVDVRFRKPASDRDLSQASASSSPGPVFAILVFIAVLGGGAMFTMVWQQANPDVRSAYGQAYERCVREQEISRWQVEEVRQCISRLPII